MKSTKKINKSKGKKEGKTYCERCGSEEKNVPLVFYGIQYYDKKTGEKRMMKECRNLNCRRGCENAGHIWKERSFFERIVEFKTCERCGSIEI